MSDLTTAIPCGDHALMADIRVPAHAKGIVVFVHGSGSSRQSPRNLQVASSLHDARLATVLFDLLTPAEGRDPTVVFDVELLAQRLVAVLAWIRERKGMKRPRIGLFGASTGAAAALLAAVDSPIPVSAVVSRGGRPDLAPRALPFVKAPTLLLVGAADSQVLEMNEQAAARLRCRNELRVIPGATHLFAEPGALELVAEAARDWFVRCLARDVRAPS